MLENLDLTSQLFLVLLRQYTPNARTIQGVKELFRHLDLATTILVLYEVEDPNVLNIVVSHS